MPDAVTETLIDEDMEQAVLGSVLCDPSAMGKIAPMLNPEDFGIDRHARLYRIMRDLFRNGTPPDAVMVGSEMGRAGIQHFDPLGYAYLAELAMAPFACCYAEHYADAVADLAERRRFLHAMSQSVTRAVKGETNPEELADETRDVLRAITRPRRHGKYRAIGDIDDDIFGPQVYRAFFGGDLEAVDVIMGGMEPGQVIVVGARTSVGKTATLLQMLWRISAVHGAPVGVISLEMPSRSLKTRMLSHVSGVNIHEIKRMNRAPRGDERKSLQEVRDHMGIVPLFIDEDPKRDLRSVVERVRAMVTEQRIAVVGIDYLQLLADNQKTENRNQELSKISGAIKQLAVELEIPIIALAQINRSVEGRTDNRPRLSDLRDSGAIEQDADVVILLSPDEAMKRHVCKVDGVSDPDKDRRRFVKFDVAKNRNGATGDVTLQYLGSSLRFAPIDAKYLKSQERAS